MTNEIKFQTIWGRTYILLGVMFGLLFIFGALVLNDYLIFLNLIASFLVIYIGINMLKRPYAIYSKKEIQIFGHLGSLRKHYKFKSKKLVSIKNNAVFLEGKKIKLNAWMVDKQDWQRFINFYDVDQSFMTELLDE